MDANLSLASVIVKRFLAMILDRASPTLIPIRLLMPDAGPPVTFLVLNLAIFGLNFGSEKEKIEILTTVL